MAISLSLYDFFARLIPGSIFLLAILYGFCETWLISPSIRDLSTSHLLLTGIFSYILGHAIEPLANRWYRFFRKANTRNLVKQAARGLADSHPNMRIEIYELHWYVLLSYIKRHQLPIAQEIERFNVTHVMLRGLSAGMLLFAGVFCLKTLTAAQAWLPVILSLLSMGIAYLLMQEAIKYRGWFYTAIYQTVLALQLAPEQVMRIQRQ